MAKLRRALPLIVCEPRSAGSDDRGVPSITSLRVQALRGSDTQLQGTGTRGTSGRKETQSHNRPAPQAVPQMLENPPTAEDRRAGMENTGFRAASERSLCRGNPWRACSNTDSRAPPLKDGFQGRRMCIFHPVPGGLGTARWRMNGARAQAPGTASRTDWPQGVHG